MSATKIVPAAGASAPVVVSIPLEQMRPSKDNPRTDLDTPQAKVLLAELAESIKTQGLIQPITVRRLDKPAGKVLFEIVAGERRYRATKLAKAETINATVVELREGQDVGDIRMAENLQRADMNPMDEARGYAQLMKFHGVEAKDLPRYVHKTESYVRRRLALLNLTEKIQGLLLGGSLSLEHGLELARLAPDVQEMAMGACFEQTWSGNRRMLDTSKPQPVRELKEWVADHSLLELKRAPWKVSDETLIPPGKGKHCEGACTECRYMTTSAKSGGLFEEMGDDARCTNALGFEEKMSAYLTRKRREIADKEGAQPLLVCTKYVWGDDAKRLPAGTLHQGQYKIASKSGTQCNHTRPALVVGGDNRADVLRVCAKAGCAVHQNSRESSSASKSEAQKNKERKERFEQAVKRETTRRAVKFIGEAYREITHDGNRRLMERVAYKLFDGLSSWSDATKYVLEIYGWKDKGNNTSSHYHPKIAAFLKEASDQDLAVFVATCAYADLHLKEHYSGDTLTPAAAAHGVDLKGIESGAREDLDPENVRRLKQEARAEEKYRAALLKVKTDGMAMFQLRQTAAEKFGLRSDLRALQIYNEVRKIVEGELDEAAQAIGLPSREELDAERKLRDAHAAWLASPDGHEPFDIRKQAEACNVPFTRAKQIVAEERDNFVAAQSAPTKFSKRDKVRVTAGPFKNKVAEVVEVLGDSYKVKIGVKQYEIGADNLKRVESTKLAGTKKTSTKAKLLDGAKTASAAKKGKKR